MACTGRFAEAWEYAAFFCAGALLLGTDNGGGAGLAYLTDTTVDFTRLGVESGVGMVLYNLTTGASGNVTAVTSTTITASGVTWSNGNSYRITTITGQEITTIQHYLDITVSDIHAAMAANDMCDCTLATWATGLLKKLNIIEASVFYICPCARTLSDETRNLYFAWAERQMEAIRKGLLELCSDETGAEFPSLDWADQSVTEFALARIIFNDMLRNL